MKILYLVHQFYPEYYTGTEKFVFNIATMMQKIGNAVKIITYSFYDDSFYDRKIGNIMLKEFTYKGIPIIAFRHKNIPEDIHIALTNDDVSEIASDIIANENPDIIHAGHVEYLQEAADLGDVLIIGLNSDNSVKRLKGKRRPINSQIDRAKVLSGLVAVDYIVIFEEDTPYKLIDHIKPDVLVKGGDWKPEEIVGSDIVLANEGSVRSLSYKEGNSTSSIINKMKE